MIAASLVVGTFLCCHDLHEIVLGWPTAPDGPLVRRDNFTQNNDSSFVPATPLRAIGADLANAAYLRRAVRWERRFP